VGQRWRDNASRSGTSLPDSVLGVVGIRDDEASFCWVRDEFKLCLGACGLHGSYSAAPELLQVVGMLAYLHLPTFMLSRECMFIGREMVSASGPPRG
jgi:hypothetical protein